MTESSTPRPIALGLDHINIATPRLAESRDFYVEVLGLQEGPRPPFEFDGYWLYAGARPLVHMQVSRGPVGPSTQSALNHVAFSVSDFDALLARLDRLSVAYDARQVPGAQIRQAFFLDPNGVRLEITEAGA